MAARVEYDMPKDFAKRSRFSDCGLTSPRRRRPMVDCATPDFLASAVCVLKCLLDAIRPAMARLHPGVGVCLRLATSASSMMKLGSTGRFLPVDSYE